MSHRIVYRYTIVQYFSIFVTIAIVYNVAKFRQKRQYFVKFNNSFVKVKHINEKEGILWDINNKQHSTRTHTMTTYFIRFADSQGQQKEIRVKAESRAEAMDTAIFYHDVDEFLFVCEEA